MIGKASGIQYCTDLARLAGEPLIASATPTRRILLLEYKSVWGEKALEESSLSDEVKKAVKAFNKQDPENKAFLIRSTHSNPNKIALFLASLQEPSKHLLAFELETYEDLLEMDLSAILGNWEEYRNHLSTETLLLVCTNGRRDACCAHFGPPVIHALQQASLSPPLPRIWQSTHIGGHRFAANLLVLPHGLLYGRVDPSSATQIMDAACQGRVHLPNLRGQIAYPKAAQAADLYLRQIRGNTHLDAFTLKEVQDLGENLWQVSFAEKSTGKVYVFEVQAEETGEMVYESCRLDKTAPLRHYQVRLLW